MAGVLWLRLEGEAEVSGVEMGDKSAREVKIVFEDKGEIVDVSRGYVCNFLN